MRILIAEDDPIYRRMLESALMKWGYEVVVTKDGTEAWQALQCPNAPKLAILDWMMPGMDGVDIIKKVRKNSKLKNNYIILATAKGYKEDITTGLRFGADDYITKPFEREEIRDSVKNGIRALALQAANSQDQLQEDLIVDSMTNGKNGESISQSDGNV
jgi:DNA-binding response OmpR family regulator